MNYRNLDLNLIKTFISVYENKSTLLASKKLFVSQPAITSSIKKLEGYLNVKLFIRTARGMTATVEGNQFYNDCRNSMQIINNSINKITSLSNLTAGRLNIGSSSTIIRKLLLPFIANFNKKYPQLILSITDATSEQLQQYTNNGTIDLAILSEPLIDNYKFEITEITQIHDCIIASKHFSEDYLPIKNFLSQKLILQKLPSNNREYFDKVCFENDILVSPTLELSSFGLITDFVANNIGLGFSVKEFIKDDIKNNRVKLIKTNIDFKSRKICAITPKVSINNLATNMFIEQLKKYFVTVEN